MSGFSINEWTLSGNLTRDPELRSLASGTSVCSMRVAYNHRWKNGQTGEWEDQPNYFDVIIWGGIGENASKKLKKGDAAVFSGRAQWREWEDKENKKRQSVELVANSYVGPVERSGGGGRTDFGPEPSRFAPQSDIPADTGDFAPAPDTGDFAPAAGQAADDDIPF